MWICGIIFGTLGLVGGTILFITAAKRFGEIAKTFIGDVRSALSSNLMTMNKMSFQKSTKEQ